MRKRIFHYQIWLFLFTMVTLSYSAQAQRYYISEHALISLDFFVSDKLLKATSTDNEIVIDLDQNEFWLGIHLSSFTTDVKKLDKKFFKKNRKNLLIRCKLNYDGAFLGVNNQLNYNLCNCSVNNDSGGIIGGNSNLQYLVIGNHPHIIFSISSMGIERDYIDSFISKSEENSFLLINLDNTIMKFSPILLY